MRRPLGEQVQRDFDGLVQLRICTAGVVLRCIVDLDVGVGAIVFDAPANVVEEERELRLGGDRTVGEAVPRPDPDHPAPRPFADQRPELHQLERVREDVTV